ncbi:MAG: Maf family protein [Candidatus Eremiobacteraeota bacterium]|nr:Maf family protein [Candidatus Eremiobacteraeota bacterium]
MKSLDRIVLASASPRRLELLRALGLDVRVVPSSYGEPPDPLKSPRQLARSHARAKLLDVLAADTYSDPVIAADTVVDLGGIAYGKPRDEADAVRMLHELSGREHLVHTAFAMAFNPPDGSGDSKAEIIEECESTTVRFVRLDRAQIERYVQTGQPLDKAGAYGIQGIGAALIEAIDGDFYTVMGFPLGKFVRSLSRLGFSPAIPKTMQTHS